MQFRLKQMKIFDPLMLFLLFLMLATTEVHLLQFTNKPYESRNIRQYQAHLFPRMTNPDLDILGSCPWAILFYCNPGLKLNISEMMTWNGGLSFPNLDPSNEPILLI